MRCAFGQACRFKKTLRRADFGFSGGARTILVDCTTISPIAKIVKDDKPGNAADYATKRKEKYYQRLLDQNNGLICNILLRCGD
jgi:hypothetical protein